MNVAGIIDAIVTEGGFDTSAVDTSRAVVLGWVQTRYDGALSASRYRKMAVEFGPTVVGQAQYAVPAHVLDLSRLRVGGSKPWLRVTLTELWEIQAGASWVYDAAGVFAPNFEVDGDQVVELYPAPGKAGDAISTVCEVTDTTALADSGASTPNIPADLHRPILVKGGIAEGLSTIEKRPDLAASFESEAAAAIKELKRRANSRIGSGPWRARVNADGAYS
jgi:hypothetical protein